MDAEEYRRFQEFQRFQDYQRFVTAQQQNRNGHLPVPAAPRQHEQQHAIQTELQGMRQQLARIERVANPPLWQKILRNRWLHRAAWLVIVIILAVWGVPALIGHYFGNHQTPSGPADLPAPKNQSHEYAQHPDDAVTDVYLFTATKVPNLACFEFTSTAARQFAQAFDAPTCDAAITALAAQVTDAGSYQDPVLTAHRGAFTSPMTISSCDFIIQGGPVLGTFTVTQQPDQTWAITAYQRQPTTCR